MTTQDKPAEKTYEAEFTVLMPGQNRATSYRIVVKASEPIEATAKAIDEWITRTEPRDVRVKEIQTPKGDTHE